MQFKTCSNKKCINVNKSIFLFSKNKNTKDGYSDWCKECSKNSRIANKEHYKEYNKKYKMSHKGPIKERKKNKLIEFPNYYLIKAAKHRAKKKNLEFNLSPNDFIIPDFCPILGIPLFRSENIKTNNSPTIDRINNNRGYIKDNIIIISWRANRLKSDSTSEEREKIFKFYYQYND